MAEREIELDTIYGGTKAVATVYGAFGVHDSEWGGAFVVTHIPTGRALTFAAPSKQSGLRLARMLTRCGARWSFSKIEKMPKRTKALGKAALERWNQHRLALR